MSTAARVTVCLPVWNGAKFLAETIAALKRQSFADFLVRVADDASSDGSADLCRSLADARFEIVVQPRRLGWVDNWNWLLERATSDYVCVLPQDDLIAPDYLATLLEHAERNPACGTAYCDIEAFGDYAAPITQDPLTGTAFERLHAFIARHTQAVPLRGLVRREVRRRAGGLRHNRIGDFAADVPWIARLAREGELHRIARPLYRKRYYPGSASAAWARLGEAATAEAWCAQCEDLADAASGLALDAAQRWLLLHALLGRLLNLRADCAPFPFIRALPPERQAAMAAAVLAAAAAAHLIEQAGDAGTARCLVDALAAEPAVAAQAARAAEQAARAADIATAQSAALRGEIATIRRAAAPYLALRRRAGRLLRRLGLLR